MVQFNLHHDNKGLVNPCPETLVKHGMKYKFLLKSNVIITW